MSNNKIHLTREGFERLQKELEYLKGEKRSQIIEAIQEARSHGDLSENAEYDAAKEDQGLNEKKIAEMEGILGRARLIDESLMNKDEAFLGAKVTIKDLDHDDEFDYFLVSEEESDFDSGKISISSPVGKALLGKKKGDVVEIKAPVGTLRYQIIAISR